MIVPQSAVDDLGQEAKATANFLRYSLVLRCRDRSPAENGFVGPLEILKEELVHIHLSEARKNIHFDHTSKWRESALRVARRGAAFISTTGEGSRRAINLHQDGGGRGRAVSNPAHQPRTLLSVANAAESPTALCARREMESWQLLQLEPSALREPDDINAPYHLDSNGRRLPATLYHLANLSNNGASISPPDPDRLYCQVANRLSELIDDVGAVRVDRDEKREILTLEAWLLIDQSAIRRAAGNPNGTVDLVLPPIGQLESITDPKECLYDLLKAACELGGRRLKKFKPFRLVRLIAENISDFSPLRQPSAFRRLETDVRQLTHHPCRIDIRRQSGPIQ